MAGRSMADRAALSLSGVQLSQDTMIRTDLRVLEVCEHLGLFIRKGYKNRHARTGTGMSQWITNQMIRAIKEELKKKGLE
jgi:hypothetical protein